MDGPHPLAVCEEDGGMRDSAGRDTPPGHVRGCQGPTAQPASMPGVVEVLADEQISTVRTDRHSREPGAGTEGPEVRCRARCQVVDNPPRALLTRGTHDEEPTV